jgi:DNA-binding transcriptional LysR family regulator
VSTQIDHKPRLVTDDVGTLRQAALDGHGVAQLPLLVGGHDIAAGALVDVLPGWAPRSGVIQAIFPSRRGLLPSVRKLVDYLAASFEDVDIDPEHIIRITKNGCALNKAHGKWTGSVRGGG